MKNFDELRESDLEFVLGGETFRMKYVRPEVLAEWEDEEEPETETAAERIERVDNRIIGFLDSSSNGDGKDSVTRYRELRAREENPVSLGQLRAVVVWMMETQTARPTEQPSALAGGRGKTAATSRAGSS